METLPINSFSKLCGIDSSKLRYWDEMGVFSPLFRNPETNYRYYSVLQLLQLNIVITLTVMKVPLKIIAELSEERTPDYLLMLFEKQERILEMEMDYIRQRYSVIRTRRELINQGIRANTDSIRVMYKDEKPILLWSKNEYDEDSTFLEPLVKKTACASDYHINLNYPIGGYYENSDTFIYTPNRPCRFFSLDPLGHQKMKAGKYLVGYSRGKYYEFGDLPERLMNYAKENALTLTGPVYIQYLFDELCTTEPDEYLAQCSIAISNRKNRLH